VENLIEKRAEKKEQPGRYDTDDRPSPSLAARFLLVDAGGAAKTLDLWVVISSPYVLRPIDIMFFRQPYEAEDMVVVEVIEHVLAVFSASDEAQGFQEPEVMRYGRQGHLEEEGEVAHAELALRQEMEDLYPCFVGEGFKKLR
jgi:hypothetical protein